MAFLEKSLGLKVGEYFMILLVEIRSLNLLTRNF